MNDDDLPVLTQVLRTGSGSREGSIAMPAEPVHESTEDALDVRPIDETWMAEQLVIGNEPHRRIDDYLMDSFGEPGPPGVEAQTPDAQAGSGPQRDDAFRRPNDQDTFHGDFGNTFGEPHLPDVVEARPAEPPPMPPEERAALALQVRDAVLEDLSTRIDTELDARIAQAMHAELETAVAQLQINLRAHLSEALRDVVQRAVDEEIARIAGPAHTNDAR